MDKKYVRWLQVGVVIVATIKLTACVTINIYFPAAAAEKAADKVIDEIWQTPAGQSPASTPSPAPKDGDVPAATPAATPSLDQESAP